MNTQGTSADIVAKSLPVEIKAVRRELLAWMDRQPGRGYPYAKRVLLSLEYCLWNPGERIGERELARDVAALATAAGR